MLQLNKVLSIALITVFSQWAIATDTASSPVATPKPSDALMGTWVSSQPLMGNGVSMHLKFDFSEHNMQVTGTCVFMNDHQHMQVTVASYVDFQGNNIQILENKNGQVSDGYRFCRVSTQVSRWQFYFDGTGNAVLIAPPPYPAQLQIKRPDVNHPHP